MSNIAVDLPINMDKLHTTIKIVKLINKHRPSLELPVLYALNGKISALINGYGRGVSWVGDKAIGKGEIIKITKKPFVNQPKEFLKHYVTFDVDKFTSSFFVEYVKKFKLDGYDFEVLLEDMSQVIDQHYLALQCYDTTSKLISDKKVGIGTKDILEDDTGIDLSSAEDITAEINSLNCYMGMTNMILAKIKMYKAYASMWKDRLTEFYPILTMAEKRRIDLEFNFNPDNPRIPASEIRNKLIELIPNDLSLIKILPLSKRLHEDYKPYIAVYKLLYTYQHTENRGTSYFNGDLSANALLNGRNEIDLTDVSFYSLFFPNLYISKYPSVIQRIIQNVLYCPDVTELRDRLGYTHEKYLIEAINRVADSEQVLEYDDKIVNLSPEFSSVIDKQQKFIKACLNYEFKEGD